MTDLASFANFDKPENTLQPSVKSLTFDLIFVINQSLINLPNEE